LVLVPVVAGAPPVADAFDEPDEPPELDEHAARPPAAKVAATSAATRLDDLDIGMWHVPLDVRSSCGPEAATGVLVHIDHCLPRDSAVLAD
jgi:hypothetical protein